MTATLLDRRVYADDPRLPRLPQQAIVLARISDADDGDTQGVDRQEKDGRRHADRLGWTIGPAETHVIVENDTSAYTRRKVCRACFQPGRLCLCPPLPGGAKRDTVLRTIRPEFRRALDMLRSGEADGLIALDLDRACRDPRDLEDLVDVVESRKPRVPVESVTGSLRLANDADVTMARVMVSVANKSSRDTGRRVASKRQENAQAGKYGGGRRPYGYGMPKLDRVTGEPLLDEETGRPLLDMSQIVEAEAAEIRRWADMVLAGVSLRAIDADLRERGVPTVTGTPWTSATVRDILLRPRNAGLAVYQVRAAQQVYRDRGEVPPYDAGVIGPAGWPPILPEETWRAVAALLTDPSRTTTTGNTPRWLGSLIYRCGVCRDAGMEQTCSISSGAADREPAYMCRGPVGHLRRSAKRVDEYVADVIVARLSQPDAAVLFRPAPAPEEDRAALSSEVNALRERANQLGAAFADGTITTAQLAAGSKRLNDRIRVIEARLAAAVVKSPLDSLPLGTDQVRAVWDTLPLGTRRAILRVLADVTLLKGKPGRYASGAYFDGETVEIEWKS